MTGEVEGRGRREGDFLGEVEGTRVEEGGEEEEGLVRSSANMASICPIAADDAGGLEERGGEEVENKLSGFVGEVATTMGGD